MNNQEISDFLIGKEVIIKSQASSIGGKEEKTYEGVITEIEPNQYVALKHIGMTGYITFAGWFEGIYEIQEKKNSKTLFTNDAVKEEYIFNGKKPFSENGQKSDDQTAIIRQQGTYFLE